MNKLFTLLLTLVVYFGKAQDTTLPVSSADIYLRSGKTIEDVRLWKIYANHTEYAYKGNLHDVANSEIEHFMIRREKYGLSDSATLFKFKYDQLLLLDGDTILCKIKTIKPDGIYYVTDEGSKLLFTENWLISKYITDGNSQTVVHNSSALSNRTAKSEGNDRIILFDGDTLYCTIRKVKSTGISYIPMGSTSYDFIERHFIKKYMIGAGDTTGNARVDSSARAAFALGKMRHADYYKRGERDGHKEYTGAGSFIGGMVMGFVPIIGWVTCPLTLAVPPRKSPHNKKLYAQNPEYHKGYNAGAKHKKTSATLLGTFSGVGILLLCIFL